MRIFNKLSILSLALVGTLLITGCGERERIHESWVEKPAAPVYGDPLIFDRINSAVLEDPQLQGFNIEIEVNGGHVVLSGLVDTQEQAERVSMHSWMMDGVNTVDNQISLQ